MPHDKDANKDLLELIPTDEAVRALEDRIMDFPLPDGMIEHFQLLNAPKRETVPFAGFVAYHLEVTDDSSRILIREYQRFMTLKALSGEALTPSKMIDAVWHLHLEFPEAYAAFCRDAVGCEVPHTPGLSKDEARRRYARTRALYAKVFGEDPPHAAWPTGMSAAFFYGTFAASFALSVVAANVVLVRFAIPEPVAGLAFVAVFFGLVGLFPRLTGFKLDHITRGEANCA